MHDVTALMEAAIFNHNKVVKLLLNHENSKDKIDITIKDEAGRSAEDIAKVNNNQEIVNLFREFKQYKRNQLVNLSKREKQQKFTKLVSVKENPDVV